MRKSYRSNSKAMSAQASSSYKDHNIAAINPLSKQFEPTDAIPIRQHAQMAGDPTGGGVMAKVKAYFSSKTTKTPAKETPAESKKPREQYIDKAVEKAEAG